jgi:hypothetical protein
MDLPAQGTEQVPPLTSLRRRADETSNEAWLQKLNKKANARKGERQNDK